MRIFLAAVLLFTSGTAVAADTPEQPTKKTSEKKICKIDEEFTGSRMVKKICRTASEWEEQRANRDSGEIEVRRNR